MDLALQGPFGNHGASRSLAEREPDCLACTVRAARINAFVLHIIVRTHLSTPCMPQWTGRRSELVKKHGSADARRSRSKLADLVGQQAAGSPTSAG